VDTEESIDHAPDIAARRHRRTGRGVLTPRAPGAMRVCVIAAAGTTQR